MAALRQTPLTCSGHTRPVVDLAFSQIRPHGYFLISACKDGKPMLRQGDTGDWIGTFEGHKGAVWGATLNHDATRAATGAADFTAKIWDAVSGKDLQTFAHKHIVKSVDFSPDGNQLLTGSNEKLVKVFDLNKPDAAPEVYQGHENSVKSALWIKDGRNIVSAAEDRSIIIWDTVSKKEVKQLLPSASVGTLELSQCGTILTVTYSNAVAFYNTETFEKIQEYEMPAKMLAASLHPEKTMFVCGGEDFKMYKFDYATGLEAESSKGHFGPVHCVSFSPDGELYASGSEDGTLRLWQTTVGKAYGLWKSINPDDVSNNTDGHGE